MALPQPYQFVRLLAETPPGLNSLLEPEDLAENEIASGTGFDLSVDRLITKGTIPSGTAAVEKTITLDKSATGGENVDNVPYLWHSERLWNITNRTLSTASNLLQVGALGYNDQFYHTNGREPIPFDEDSQTILKILPLEPDSFYIGKTTGGYVLRNLSDTRGFFQRTDLIQELALPAANQVAELDSVLYVTNAQGLMAYQNGQTREVSQKIRGVDLSGLAITVDHGQKYVILGSTHVYDAANDKWFEYSGSAFSFKTRVVRNPDWSPFDVDRIIFVVKNTGEDDAQITYKYKFDDDDWSDEYTADVLYEEGTLTTVSETLDIRRAGRRFQLEITGMDAGVSIREILLDVQNFQFDSEPS